MFKTYRASLTGYPAAVWKHWKWLAVTVFAGFIGLLQEVWPKLVLPTWMWLTVAGGAAFVAQFLAYHDMRVERDALKPKRQLERWLELLAMKIELGRAILGMVETYADDVALLVGAGSLLEPNESFREGRNRALTKAREWEEATEEFLRKRRMIYSTRFRNEYGVPSDIVKDPIASAPFGVTETEKMLKRRLYRLDQISGQVERAELAE